MNNEKENDKRILQMKDGMRKSYSSERKINSNLYPLKCPK